MTNPNWQVQPGGSFVKFGSIYIMSGSQNPTDATIDAPTGSMFIRNAGSASDIYKNYTTSDSGSQWRTTTAASG